MAKFEKRYAKVMKEKEEITTDMVKFLFSAINFIVDTGKLAEFMDWQVKEAEKKCGEEVMKRVEVWKGCIGSFYRSRHERQPRFKSGKRLHLSVSNHKRHREMIRWYVQKIRAEKGGEKG